MGGYYLQWSCTRTAPERGWSQILPLSLSGTILWPVALWRPGRVEGGGSCMIRRGSREGGGRRNLALVQLQSCDHPSGSASSLQTGNSQLECLPVVIPAHSCARLSSLPLQTAWTPHSSPVTASPPSDSAPFKTMARAILRSAKSFSLAQAELLSSPRCSSHLVRRALTSSHISLKSHCNSCLPDFCGKQLCAPCARAPQESLVGSSLPPPSPNCPSEVCPTAPPCIQTSSLLP